MFVCVCANVGYMYVYYHHKTVAFYFCFQKN